MRYPQTWPGTNIPRSQGNAFDWRNKPSEVFARWPELFKHGTHSANGVKQRARTEQRLSPAQMAAEALRKARHGGAYSKAQAATK